MNNKEINELLESFGYQLSFHHGMDSLSIEQLYTESMFTGQPFLSILSDSTHSLYGALLSNHDVINILVKSFNDADLVIPECLLVGERFELVSPKREKKRLKGQVINGLYAFLETYQAELEYALKSIQRKDGSHAFLIEVDGGTNHLSIDKFYTDEHENGQFFYYYAHVSMSKEGARVRIYFDENLKQIKTTAYIEEDGVKRERLNPQNIGILPEDFSKFFNILKELKNRHHQKIQDLNILFTSKFMFIKNLDMLSKCRQDIQEINRLKSPFYDVRQDYLTNELYISQQIGAPAAEKISGDSVSNILEVRPNAAQVARPKPQARTPKKRVLQQQRKIDAIKHLGQAIDTIHAHIQDAERISGGLIQALDDILKLEFLLIQYSQEVNLDKSGYDAQVNGLKLNCLNLLYNAFLRSDIGYLTQSYDQGKTYIDSIIYHYFIELFEKLNLGELSVTVKDKEKFKKLTHLLQFYFDKNELFERFVYFLNRQLAYNPNNDIVFSFIMRVIHIVDDASFIEFLIRKKILSPSDCIGVIRSRYISLQQYVLISLTELSPCYYNLIDCFLREGVSLLSVTNTQAFEKIIKQPQSYSSFLYRSEVGLNRRFDSACSEFQGVGVLPKDVKPFERINFLEFLGYQNVIEPYLTVCQTFFLNDAVLAFNYLTSLVNSTQIQRRVIMTLEPEVVVLSNSEDLNMYTYNACIGDGVRNAVSYFFYPQLDAPVSIIQKLEVAKLFLERIKTQAFLNALRNDKQVLLSLMDQLKWAKNFEQKSSCLLSGMLYIMFMTWNSKTFEKFCFFHVKFLELWAELNNFDLFFQNLQLIKELIEAFDEPDLKSFCNKQILRSLEIVGKSYPLQVEESVKNQFR